MRMKLFEIHPNPFRDMKNYPINREKINELKQSINQTGFWDNLLARNNNGIIEIAYGHHRLIALKELFSNNYEVDIPIKELSDELMIKIMANENMSDWSTSVDVTDETVRAVRRFLNNNSHTYYNGVDEVSKFLGWKKYVVDQSFFRINLIDDGIVEQKAIRIIENRKGATEFCRITKELKLNREVQIKAAKIIRKKNKNTHSQIRKIIIETSDNNINENISALTNKIKDSLQFVKKAQSELNKVTRLKQKNISFNYKFHSNSIVFVEQLKVLGSIINLLIRELNNEN